LKNQNTENKLLRQNIQSRAIELLRKGLRIEDIAEEIGVHPITVTRWREKLRQGGKAAVFREYRGRKPESDRRLPLEDEKKVICLISNKTPDQCQRNHFLWTPSAVGDLIKSDFGIDMTLRSVNNYLRRWGINSDISSLSCVSGSKIKLLDRWRKKEYPLIRKEALNQKAEINWCIPKTKMMTRSMFKSVDNRKKVKFMVYQDPLAVEIYVKFLEQLLKGTPRHVIAIFRRFRVKDRGSLSNWLAQHKDRITLFLMP
jgi:transposase